MKKILIGALAALFVACGSSPQGSSGKVVKSSSADNGLTVSIATSDGILKHGNSEFTLTFADSSGKPVDVGGVAFAFHMPQMGTMAEMNNSATLTTTSTPGVYSGKSRIEVAGEWQVRITYEGAKGRGQVSFPVMVQ
jgi:YtkA-like protein